MPTLQNCPHLQNQKSGEASVLTLPASLPRRWAPWTWRARRAAGLARCPSVPRCYSWSGNPKELAGILRACPAPSEKAFGPCPEKAFGPCPEKAFGPCPGLHLIPLCLSSFPFLKINFSTFQLSHFPPPPPLRDSPGSRKEPCPESLAPPGQIFSKCQTLRNLGTRWSGLWPQISFLLRPRQSPLSFLMKEFTNWLFCGPLALRFAESEPGRKALSSPVWPRGHSGAALPPWRGCLPG